jgi:hypothetical protein
MGVKAALAIAAAVAIVIAMMLPVPGKRDAEARTSTIPTMEVGQG